MWGTTAARQDAIMRVLAQAPPVLSSGSWHIHAQTLNPFSIPRESMRGNGRRSNLFTEQGSVHFEQVRLRLPLNSTGGLRDHVRVFRVAGPQPPAAEPAAGAAAGAAARHRRRATGGGAFHCGAAQCPRRRGELEACFGVRSSLCERTVRLSLGSDGTGGVLLEAVHFTAEQRDVLDVMVSLTASCVRDAL